MRIVDCGAGRRIVARTAYVVGSRGSCIQIIIGVAEADGIPVLCAAVTHFEQPVGVPTAVKVVFQVNVVVSQQNLAVIYCCRAVGGDGIGTGGIVIIPDVAGVGTGQEIGREGRHGGTALVVAVQSGFHVAFTVNHIDVQRGQGHYLQLTGITLGV